MNARDRFAAAAARQKIHQHLRETSGLNSETKAPVIETQNPETPLSPQPKTRKRKPLSPERRRQIAEAQKAYWANRHAFVLAKVERSRKGNSK